MQKVLVIEDDQNINQVICENLKNDGYEAIFALDGKQAYDLIYTEESISLIILDIMLPYLSGEELLKIIRENDRTKQIPVIMLTAIQEEKVQLNCYESLADDYVTKPFSLKVLMKRVGAILRRTLPVNKELKIGNITLNIESLEVRENEQKIQLTLKEFEILKLLVENKNRIMTREELVNCAWGYDYFGDERIVDVHIKNIRKKFKTEVITTVKGVGYRIEESSLEARYE